MRRDSRQNIVDANSGTDLQLIMKRYILYSKWLSACLKDTADQHSTFLSNRERSKHIPILINLYTIFDCCNNCESTF